MTNEQNQQQIQQLLQRTAGLLRLAGIVMVLVALRDYILLLFPLKIGDFNWQLGFTTQMVEQGALPLIGIAFIFSGYGFDVLRGAPQEREKLLRWWQNLNFWVFVLSCILGVAFVLIAPLHVLNALGVQGQTVERISQEAERSKEQLEANLQLQRQEFSSLLASEPKLENYVGENQLTEEQLERLQAYKDDPAELENQINVLRNTLEPQIEKRKTASIARAKTGTLRSIVRVGSGSLLLSLCYLLVAWTGLRGNKKRKQQHRHPPIF